MIRKYYVSSPAHIVHGRYGRLKSAITVQVNVRDGVIVWGAPVIYKFMGQPFSNLLRWMEPDVIEEINATKASVTDPDL